MGLLAAYADLVSGAGIDLLCVFNPRSRYGGKSFVAGIWFFHFRRAGCHTSDGKSGESWRAFLVGVAYRGQQVRPPQLTRGRQFSPRNASLNFSRRRTVKPSKFGRQDKWTKRTELPSERIHETRKGSHLEKISAHGHKSLTDGKREIIQRRGRGCRSRRADFAATRFSTRPGDF